MLVIKAVSLILIFTLSPFAAATTVWVGSAAGVAAYDDAGALLYRAGDYRRPLSLAVDAGRDQIWFIEGYDYRLVCLNASTGQEKFSSAKAVSPPEVGTSDLKTYTLEKRPVEPSLSLDPGDGGVWVADFYGHKIAKYDAAGREVFRAAGFHEPFAVVALGDGRAWVSGGIRTIDLIKEGGARELSQPGVNEPRGLTYDPAADILWVADYRNSRVLGVDRAGRLKKRVTGVELPWLLAYDQKNGVLWVATHYAGIARVDEGNEKVSGWISPGDTPAAITLDREGRLWVAYADAGEVRRISPAGEVTTVLTRLTAPTAIAAE